MLAPTARKWKTETIELLRTMNLEAPTGRLHVVARFYSPRWLCLNGNVRKSDVSNREKIAMDSLFEVLGIDDSMVFHLELVKVVADEERTEIEVIEIA